MCSQLIVLNSFRIRGGKEEKGKEHRKSCHNMETFAPLKGTKYYTLVYNRNANVRYGDAFLHWAIDDDLTTERYWIRKHNVFALVIFSNLCGVQVLCILLEKYNRILKDIKVLRNTKELWWYRICKSHKIAQSKK